MKIKNPFPLMRELAATTLNACPSERLKECAVLVDDCSETIVSHCNLATNLRWMASIYVEFIGSMDCYPYAYITYGDTAIGIILNPETLTFSVADFDDKEDEDLLRHTTADIIRGEGTNWCLTMVAEKRGVVFRFPCWSMQQAIEEAYYWCFERIRKNQKR